MKEENVFCAIPVDYIDTELKNLVETNREVFDKYDMLIRAKQTNVKIAAPENTEVKTEQVDDELEQGTE